MATGCFGYNSMPAALNENTPTRIFCIKYTVFVANMVLRFQMFWNSRHSATDTTRRRS